MYIERYWGNIIGGTDDSLTLLEYLGEKGKEELALSEIFADTGLDRLDWDFRAAELPLVYESPEGWEYAFAYAIDLVTDLAALLLECRVSGHVSLAELTGEEGRDICITATPEEHAALDRALAAFAAGPLDYDLREMVPEEELLELARDCECLRGELYSQP